MATGPLGTDPTAASLQAERDALARRCQAAEEKAAQLERELADARQELAALRDADEQGLSLFADQPASPDRLTGDGSDPRVLSMVLAATAVVAGMVAFLALVNGKVLTPFGVAIVLLTIALAWAAARTRVTPVEVSVVRGIVYIEKGESTYRFDIRKPETGVDMVGQPGDHGWAVHFARRHLEPFVVDASMVDAHEFVRRLREYRPDL